jgi:hypothetical protein
MNVKYLGLIIKLVLSIKCLACGFEFESAYQMDEESFKTTEVKDRNEACSHEHS